MPVRLYLNNVGKSFTMHLQGGTVIPVVEKVEFSVNSGECVVLGGPSGAGMSRAGAVRGPLGLPTRLDCT